MARVTVEDCVLKVPNRFELVMMASNRAKHLERGSQITVDRDNDKNTVVALREIADGTIELDKLKEALVTDLQKLKKIEEKAPEVEELRAIDMAADDDLMSISDDEESLSNAGFSEATDDNLDDEQ